MKWNVENITKLTFVELQLYHAEKPHNLALHIEAVNLADGDYELVPADSRVDQEVILNCANLSQDLGQAPEVFLPDSAREGKPRSIIPLFSELLFIYLFIMCCNTFISAFNYSRS